MSRCRISFIVCVHSLTHFNSDAVQHYYYSLMKLDTKHTNCERQTVCLLNTFAVAHSLLCRRRMRTCTVIQTGVMSPRHPIVLGRSL